MQIPAMHFNTSRQSHKKVNYSIEIPQHTVSIASLYGLRLNLINIVYTVQANMHAFMIINYSWAKFTSSSEYLYNIKHLAVWFRKCQWPA